MYILEYFTFEPAVILTVKLVMHEIENEILLLQFFFKL